MLSAPVDFPRAWEIDTSFELRKANESGSDEEDNGSGAEEEPKVQPAPADRRSPGFADFLQFLELGCGGSPLQGYPAAIVILSSIPPSVRIQSSTLFVYYSVTLTLALYRSYFTRIPGSLPARFSPHSGPPSMDAPLVPSIAPPSPLRSLTLYLSAQRS